MKKISIIVPAYNAEKYIARCIESILAQIHNELEVIVVNDGSVDKTKDICESYSRKDRRVKVVDQDNAGVSMARNTGIAVSRGEYIGFVDADDYVSPSMFKRMIDQAECDKSDLVICDSLSVDGERTEEETISSLVHSVVLSKEEIVPDVLIEIAGSVWRCIYRADLLKKNNLSFPVGLKISEDRIFNLYAIGFTNRISYIKEKYYYRVIHRESTVHRYHPDYYEIVKKGRDETERALNSVWNGDINYKIIFLQQYVYGAIMAIENLKHKESNLSYILRLKYIRRICQDAELKKAIQVTNYAVKDVRSKWILDGNIFALNMKSMRLYWLVHGIQSVYKREGIYGLLIRVMRKR